MPEGAQDIESQQPIEPQRRHSDNPNRQEETTENPIKEKQLLSLLLTESKGKVDTGSGEKDRTIEEQKQKILEQSEKIQQLEKQLERLAQEAKIDKQTGLFNKNEFIDELYPAFMQSFRTGKPLGILSLDVQGLKKINDEIGHEAGDELIAKFGETIREVMDERKRESDKAFRVGGDEIVILLPDTDIEGVKAAGEAFMKLFSERGIKTGIGGGVADVTDWNTMQSTVKDIDHALYVSKARNYETGENNIEIAA